MVMSKDIKVNNRKSLAKDFTFTVFGVPMFDQAIRISQLSLVSENKG